MTLDTRLERLTLAFALSLPGATSLALMVWAPGRVEPTTYAVVVALLLGTTTVALNTWSSAQATGSLGQLLYETNAGIYSDADRSRWERWRRQYDNSAARSRILAMLVLSAVTTALIVSTWLS